ncbi:MAG: hypothetical protein LBS16_05900, partial [Prevotellaceae bacterium]|nr:hypothetical protein [Prevotellaceae bacterium]
LCVTPCNKKTWQLSLLNFTEKHRTCPAKAGGFTELHRDLSLRDITIRYSLKTLGSFFVPQKKN